MSDVLTPSVRERVWVEKVDKSGPEPRVVERVFVENGVLLARETCDEPVPKEEAAHDTDGASR